MYYNMKISTVIQVETEEESEVNLIKLMALIPEMLCDLFQCTSPFLTCPFLKFHKYNSFSVFKVWRNESHKLFQANYFPSFYYALYIPRRQYTRGHWQLKKKKTKNHFDHHLFLLDSPNLVQRKGKQFQYVRQLEQEKEVQNGSG